MKDGTTDFLDDFDTDAAEAAPVVEQASEPQADQQPRGPDGKFAEKVQQGVKPEAQPAPEPEPPSEDEGSPHVPRAALLAERQKRQALEAELAKLKPTAAAAQPQNQPPKGPEFAPLSIDFEQDPNGFVAAIPDLLVQQKMQMSTFWASQQHGEGEVAEAWAAFNEAAVSDPETNALSWKLRDHQHPMGEVLKWYGRQKDMRMLSEAGGLEKLREKWLADALATTGAQPAPAAQGVAPAQSRPAPPPSLANGGAGSHQAPEIPSEDDDFNGLFAGARKPRKR